MKLALQRSDLVVARHSRHRIIITRNVTAHAFLQGFYL